MKSIITITLLSLLCAGCYQVHSDDDLRAVPTTNNPNSLPVGKTGPVPKAGF